LVYLIFTQSPFLKDPDLVAVIHLAPPRPHQTPLDLYGESITVAVRVIVDFGAPVVIIILSPPELLLPLSGPPPIPFQGLDQPVMTAFLHSQAGLKYEFTALFPFAKVNA